MSTAVPSPERAVSRSRCAYHPDRDGVGICMTCHTVICTECSTRLDGINHCAVCVARLSRRAESKTRQGSAGWRVVAVIFLLFGLGLGTWGVLYMLYLW